ILPRLPFHHLEAPISGGRRARESRVDTIQSLESSPCLPGHTARRKCFDAFSISECGLQRRLSGRSRGCRLMATAARSPGEGIAKERSRHGYALDLRVASSLYSGAVNQRARNRPRKGKLSAGV